jgi:hypothetical protein
MRTWPPPTGADPLRPVAVEAGFRSAHALPMRTAGSVIGALDRFDPTGAYPRPTPRGILHDSSLAPAFWFTVDRSAEAASPDPFS